MPAARISHSFFNVHSRPEHAHPLRIHLRDVRQTLGQDVAGHLVSKLVPELSRLSSRPVHRRSCIRYRASHDAADRWRELVDVGDGGGVDQLVLYPAQTRLSRQSTSTMTLLTYRYFLLGQDYCAVLAPDADGCDVRCGDCLEGILCANGGDQQLSRKGAVAERRSYRLGRDAPGRRRW
jgi:hypothetical protein